MRLVGGRAARRLNFGLVSRCGASLSSSSRAASQVQVLGGGEASSALPSGIRARGLFSLCIDDRRARVPFSSSPASLSSSTKVDAAQSAFREQQRVLAYSLYRSLLREASKFDAALLQTDSALAVLEVQEAIANVTPQLPEEVQCQLEMRSNIVMLWNGKPVPGQIMAATSSIFRMSTEHLQNNEEEADAGAARDWLQRGFAALNAISASRRVVVNTERGREERERWRDLIAMYAACATSNLPNQSPPSIEDGMWIMVHGASKLREMKQPPTGSGSSSDGGGMSASSLSQDDLDSMSREELYAKLAQLERKANRPSLPRTMSLNKEASVAVSGALDRMADDVSSILPRGIDAQDPESVGEVIDCINRVLYTSEFEWGFEGVPYAGLKQSERLNPQHSLLDAVVENRKGLPSAMCLLYAAVGRRLGITFDVICMPAHCLVQPRAWSRSAHPALEFDLEGDNISDGTSSMQDARFVDAWGKGRIVDVEWCKNTIRMLTKEEKLLPSWLAPVSPIVLYARMLRNLISGHRRQGESDEAMFYLDQLMTILNESSDVDLVSAPQLA